MPETGDTERPDEELVDAVVRVEGDEDPLAEGTCPRCGGDLSRYTLFGRRAVACDDCGFVGAETDHTATPVERESWTAALERFREQSRSETE